MYKTIFVSLEEYLQNKGELHLRESIYIEHVHSITGYSLVGFFKKFDIDSPNHLVYLCVDDNKEVYQPINELHVEIEVTPIYVAF